MILTERNVNEETSFLGRFTWIIPSLGLSSPFFMIGILSVYVAVSRLSPNGVAFLGQQLAWIGVGCVICLIVTILAMKFLWKITLSLPVWPSLDGSSPLFL